MDYNPITNFLEKFKTILFQKEETKSIVVRIISDEIKYSVKESSVKIKNGCIYVEGSPILRSEILIHKKQILVNLKNLLPNTIFFDIK